MVSYLTCADDEGVEGEMGGLTFTRAFLDLEVQILKADAACLMTGIEVLAAANRLCQGCACIMPGSRLGSLMLASVTVFD